MMWEGYWMFGWFMWVFWILILVGLVIFIKWLVQQSRPGETRQSESPLEILKKVC